MSTLNGFGTLYFGWRHAPDGSATATKWFALSWVPVIPLYRERLRVLTNFKGRQDIRPAPGGLGLVQVNHFELIEPLPLSLLEIAITLVKTYIGIPALIVVPMLLLVLLMRMLGRLGVEVNPGSWAFNIVYLGGASLVMLNFLIQIVRTIRRTRGWQPG